jgi:hypothetical protein
MRHWIARYHAWLLLILVTATCLGGAWGISLTIPLPAHDEFNIVRWEVRHLPGKWLYLTNRFFGGGLSPEEEEQRLGRFLVLTARIRQLGRALPPDELEQRTEMERLRRERDALENDVEAIIEGRLTASLEDAGLQASIPLFPNARLVFPPVDFELDQPLRVVAVSRRDRIELIERRPLRQELTSAEAVQIEAALEADGSRSALVEALAGAATYPSIVAPQGDYQRLVETVAHEWVHHYLFFQPLGQRYFSSLELQTLNETVADLAGRDLAALVLQRYPLPPEVASELELLLPPEPEIDVGSVLRQLRLDVGALLGQGRVEAAEALMEQRRLELNAALGGEQGVAYRRINQAFFASRSVYADNPASIDPLGLKLEALRERTGSVGAFLRAAARLTGGDDLGRLLQEAVQPAR